MTHCKSSTLLHNTCSVAQPLDSTASFRKMQSCVGSDRQGTDLVLVLLLRAFLMKQNRGKQGSHSAHVPTNILVMDSPKVACNKQHLVRFLCLLYLFTRLTKHVLSPRCHQSCIDYSTTASLVLACNCLCTGLLFNQCQRVESVLFFCTCKYTATCA